MRVEPVELLAHIGLCGQQRDFLREALLGKLGVQRGDGGGEPVPERGRLRGRHAPRRKGSGLHGAEMPVQRRGERPALPAPRFQQPVQGFLQGCKQRRLVARLEVRIDRLDDAAQAHQAGQVSPSPAFGDSRQLVEPRLVHPVALPSLSLFEPQFQRDAAALEPRLHRLADRRLQSVAAGRQAQPQVEAAMIDRTRLPAPVGAGGGGETGHGGKLCHCMRLNSLR